MNIICLMDTKNEDTYCKKIRTRMRMTNKEYVNPGGTWGGLAPWWKTTTSIQILFTSYNFIDCEVIINQDEDPTFIMCVYADTEAQKRTKNWKLEGKNQGHKGS